MTVAIFIVLSIVVSGTMAQGVASTGTYVPDPRYDPIIDEFLNKYRNDPNCHILFHNNVQIGNDTAHHEGWINVTGLDRAKRIAPVQRKVRTNGDLDLLTVFHFQQASGVLGGSRTFISDATKLSINALPFNVTTPNVVANFFLPKDVTHESSATYYLAEEPEFNEVLKNAITGTGVPDGIPYMLNVLVREKFPGCYQPIFRSLLPVLAKVPA